MRERHPLTVTTVPRNALLQPHHKDIDAILKDLRLCSRRIKSALDSFTDEVRTLERLYYKCKNQHRMALFFKRVPEIRRYGRRLRELDILERVDLFRASFVGLEHTSDQKALRSSWTHVPERPHVSFLTERLTAWSTLVCKMRERLEKAYHHFTLAMQTGAFVQLIVLFVAISSRMSALLSELQDVLQLSKSTCSRLLTIIHPTGTHTTTPQQLPLEPEAPRPSHTDYDVPSEDTGQPVSRCEAINTSRSVAEDAKTDTVPELRVTPPLSHSTHGTDDSTQCDHATAQSSKKAVIRMAQKSRPKKAKKKFDEIDEIFGF